MGSIVIPSSEYGESGELKSLNISSIGQTCLLLEMKYLSKYWLEVSNDSIVFCFEEGRFYKYFVVANAGFF